MNPHPFPLTLMRIQITLIIYSTGYTQIALRIRSGSTLSRIYLHKSIRKALLCCCLYLPVETCLRQRFTWCNNKLHFSSVCVYVRIYFERLVKCVFQENVKGQFILQAPFVLCHNVTLGPFRPKSREAKKYKNFV